MANYLSFNGVDQEVTHSGIGTINPNWVALYRLGMYPVLNEEYIVHSYSSVEAQKVTYLNDGTNETLVFQLSTNSVRTFTFPIVGSPLVVNGDITEIEFEADVDTGIFRAYINSTEASNTQTANAFARFRDFDRFGRSATTLDSYIRVDFYSLEVWSDLTKTNKVYFLNADSSLSNGAGDFLYEDINSVAHTSSPGQNFGTWESTPVQGVTSSVDVGINAPTFSVVQNQVDAVVVDSTVGFTLDAPTFSVVQNQVDQGNLASSVNIEVDAPTFSVQVNTQEDNSPNISVTANAPATVFTGSTTTITATVQNADTRSTLNLGPGDDYTIIYPIPYEYKKKYKNGVVEVRAACQNSVGDYVSLLEQPNWLRDENGVLQFNPDNTVALTDESSVTRINDQEEAYTFLARSSFGGTESEINSLVGTNAVDWVEDQLSKPYTSYVETLRPEFDIGGSNYLQSVMSIDLQTMLFWDGAIDTEGNGFVDPLRQRLIYALSQIIVANDSQQDKGHREAYYIDQLGKNAFGNYRDILYDITYTPLMGMYLTYLGNKKFDPVTGASPDENYAREILQLFSIGLLELNMDGTPKLDAQGRPIETYDNVDIEELAKVFTGFKFNFELDNVEPWLNPMIMVEADHATSEKAFLDVVIPANTSGADTINLAIDGIFNHPNVPPFVSRQLIQRFTASNPDPSYVERVATVFANGSFTSNTGKVFGSGSRGDMKATIAAILLDESLFTGVSDTTKLGKIREPVLKWIHLNRAIGMSNIESVFENEIRFNIGSDLDGIGQRPFDSPSVFNYYRPNFIAPSSESSVLGLTTPELQILDSNTTVAYINFITSYIIDNTLTPNGVDGVNYYEPDYTYALSIADNATTLVDYYNLIMTGNSLSTSSRQAIIDAISTVTINNDDDRLGIIHACVMMIACDSSFAVIN